jgi:hypothetical protein
MKTITISVLVVLLVEAVTAVDPGKAAERRNSTLYYIHSIGDGTLVVNSCLVPDRFAVKTDQKTAVMRLDGTAGKLGDLKVGQRVKLYPRDGGYDPENKWIAKIEVDSEPMKLVDETQAATAEVVVRGTVVANARGPGRSGRPTVTLTVSEVFKTPKDVKIDVGQKLTVKMNREFTGPVTLYLVFDRDQELYRLQDRKGQGGFSHLDAGGLCFDMYSGYFVSNKFEPDAAESYVVLNDQDQFDKVFGVAFVMNDKSHRLPKDAFESLIIVAVIKRGNAFWEFETDVVHEQRYEVLLFFVSQLAPLRNTMPHLDALAATGGGCMLSVVNDRHLAYLVCGLPAVVVRLHFAVRQLIDAAHGLPDSFADCIFDFPRPLPSRVSYRLRADFSGPPLVFPSVGFQLCDRVLQVRGPPSVQPFPVDRVLPTLPADRVSAVVDCR